MKSLLDQMLNREFYANELPIRHTKESLRAGVELDEVEQRLEARLGEGGRKIIDEFCSAKNACDYWTYSQAEKDMFCLGALLILEITTHAHQVLESSADSEISLAENSRPPTGQIPFTSGEELKRV